ncbi:MarR family winged helix-turn-helix transcriptional regulator [Paenirhodobacter populi]|uniref:MarR family transcriptional regulator n=1 Tax=Paenirhodobacter populi TaxID=2306993 RepID=A0A443ILZ4_9RHOB|nr:MarR family transcriptional regulator [Sinirhodobacter populi]RWR06275.1 MarR family transcriptional regulator [Sinirhodobacter populi]RWR06690.1 MarR family transcriptional regulator [Sinirhodobacter populi]RWR18336.1 MarR family transcriptional regulator [Sinirhodobacter populi]RWR27500.1 MarR family transcriptional regulator [Sinirhodobacter populi]
MPDPSRESLGFLLIDAGRAVRRRFELRAAELGLSAAQWRVIAQLHRHGPLPQARLAEYMEIEPISVSRLAERMEKAGWIRREADPHDRRIKLVAPTDKATAAFAEARSIADALYADALAGTPPGTRETLIAILKAITNNLSPGTDHD